jgi:hypothetical protein
MVGIAMVALFIMATVAPRVAAQSGSYLFPIQVTSADVQLRESNPVQVAVDVEGIIPSGCASFEEVVQWRDGNQIVVRVLARHSGADICTMIAQIYRDTTLVDGPLPPGDYVVDVNGVTNNLRIN